MGLEKKKKKDTYPPMQRLEDKMHVSKKEGKEQTIRFPPSPFYLYPSCVLHYMQTIALQLYLPLRLMFAEDLRELGGTR